MDVKVLDSANFQETLANTEKIAIVDFYADWCMPCKMLAPVLEELAAESDDIVIFKVNIDHSPDLAEKYGVRSIPTIISFKNSEVYRQVVGVQPKAGLMQLYQE